MGCSSCARRKKAFLTNVQKQDLIDSAIKFGSDTSDKDLKGKDLAFKKLQMELSSRAQRINAREERIKKRNERIKKRNEIISSKENNLNKDEDMKKITSNLRKYKNLNNGSQKRAIY